MLNCLFSTFSRGLQADVLVGDQSRVCGAYQKKFPMARKSNHVKVTHTVSIFYINTEVAWEIEYYVNVWTSPRRYVVGVLI